MTYRERRLARADRLRGWADKRAAKAGAAFNAAAGAVEGIPFGQPILVGHHSERRHRAALDRHDSKMRAGFEHEQKAVSMVSRADNIEAAAAGAIYNDDPDAIEQLTAKLAGLEAARERIKTVNKLVRKNGLANSEPYLTDAEKNELLTLMRVAPYQKADTRGFPSYVLSNLGGNISRLKARLALLSGGPKAAAVADAVKADGATATARAGLVITQTMTTPTRPGKQPRPVWNVSGDVANWRQALLKMGASSFRGTISFWDDPTDDIEAMCADAEAPANDAAEVVDTTA